MTDETPTTRSPDEPPGQRRLSTTPTNRASLAPAVTGVDAADDRTAVIWVTSDRDPDSVLASLRDAATADLPPSVDIIAVDDCLRSTATDDGTTSTAIPHQRTELTVHTLPAAGDIDTLGQALVDTVTGLDHSGLVPSLVIDGLAGLLAEPDPERLFQFLHLVTGTARAHGWTVHVSLDPETVGSEVVDLVAPLFDDVH